MEKIRNLDDVERYMKEHAPDWRVSRGYRTDIPSGYATNHEVVQVYRPGEYDYAFAEFWRGYYDFAPEDHTGFCGAHYGHFSLRGGLEYAIKHVMQENRRLKSAPAVLDAVTKAINQDKILSEIASPISTDHLERITWDYRHWSVDCDKFKLNALTRCVMHVDLNDDGEIIVNYWIQKRDHDDRYVDVEAKTYTFPAVANAT